MITTESAVEAKIQELCATIAEDDEVKMARSRAEAFLADPKAVEAYREMALLGRELQQNQQSGIKPTEGEIARFRRLQERCDEQPLVAPFLEAQQFLNGIAERVSVYVGKTLEKGSVPTEDEISSQGCCGSGGGCGCE